MGSHLPSLKLRTVLTRTPNFAKYQNQIEVPGFVKHPLQVHFQVKNEQFIKLSVELVILHLLCHNCAWLGCSAFIDEDNGIMMSHVRVSITVAKFILSLTEDPY